MATEDKGASVGSVGSDSPTIADDDFLDSHPVSSSFDTKSLAKKYGIPEDLSKRQTKKLIKQRKREEHKSEWRKAKRAREKEKRQRIKDQGGGASLVPKRPRLREQESSGVRVAVELGYDHLMNDADIIKLCKQLRRCYAENRRVARTLQLCMTSFGGRVKSRMDQYEAGHHSWNVCFKEDSFLQVFDKKDTVFLCAESPNILERVEPGKTYVIGGLVDHNHHKGHCFSQAQEWGLEHAQLPISSYVVLNSRKVLTINHVFEIILSVVNNGGDWKEAFYSVLPARKLETTPTANEPNQQETESISDSDFVAEEVLDKIVETESTKLESKQRAEGDTEAHLKSEPEPESECLVPAERRAGDPVRCTAGVKIFAPDFSLREEGEDVHSDHNESGADTTEDVPASSSAV